MIKLLTAEQIRAWDRYTMEHEPVSPIDLMERACRAFVEWLVQRISISDKIAVVCGTGNNGGDGLGIARLLHGWGYHVNVWVVRGVGEPSPDFNTNFERLRAAGISSFDFNGAPKSFGQFDVIVDAIFGSGLSRAAEGAQADAIESINATEAWRVAVDVPSGLSCDEHLPGPTVRAHATVSFQIPKLSFLLPQSSTFVGEWHTVNIGLSKTFLKSTDSPYFFFRKRDAESLLRPRSTFDHKGKFGHLLVVAGSTGKMGAAVLATRASLRSGVGLVTAHVPQSGYVIIQSAAPEAMALLDDDEHQLTSCPTVENFSTIAIGPGLGTAPSTRQALKEIFASFRRPVVLDADALNLAAQDQELFDLIPPGSILTPHPKEFERLIRRKWSDDFERLELQKELSARLQSIVVLKGAFTSIAAPDGKVWFNSSGNPGMAKGGSGDVLTGLLGGLLAQEYSPLECAQLGVFLHGLAGDLAMKEHGMVGMNASDIVNFLPAAFRTLAGRKN